MGKTEAYRIITWKKDNLSFEPEKYENVYWNVKKLVGRFFSEIGNLAQIRLNWYVFSR